MCLFSSMESTEGRLWPETALQLYPTPLIPNITTARTTSNSILKGSLRMFWVHLQCHRLAVQCVLKSVYVHAKSLACQ